MPKVSDAHRRARRQQIIDAAVDCFAREGFHRTSMQDIIAASKLSAGAIYKYFRSKDAIVEAIAEERHARETAMLVEAVGAGDLADGLRKLVRAYFDWLRDPAEQRRRRVTVQVWAEALRNQGIAAIVDRGMSQRGPATKAFRAARARGDLPRGLDPDALSRFMLAVIQGFVLQQAWQPSIDIDGFVAVIDWMVDSLLPAPAARRSSKRGLRASRR